MEEIRAELAQRIAEKVFASAPVKKLLESMSMANEEIMVGQQFKHYKHSPDGVVYEIEGFATNPNTEERIVIYHTLNYLGEFRFWRPIDEFREKFKRVDSGGTFKVDKLFGEWG